MAQHGQIITKLDEKETSMFVKIMGVLYLVLSFMGYAVSVYHLRLFDYASIISVVIFTTAFASAAIGCWLIFRR